MSMPRGEPDALLSVAQAATLLGVHPNTIRAWTDGGRLTAYRINARGDRRFRRDDVVRLLVEDAHDDDADPVAPELALVARVSAGLAASPTIGGVARAIVEALRTELHAARAAVYVDDDVRLALETHAGFEVPPPAVRLADEGPGPGDAHFVLRTRRAAVGLLVVDRGTGERVGPQRWGAFLAAAATSLATARLLHRARRELQRARALRSVTKELTGTLDPTRVLGGIVELTRSLFEADKAGLWLSEEGPKLQLSIAAHHGLSPRFRERVAGLRGDEETIGLRALRERRPYWMGDAGKAPEIGQLREAYADEGIRTVCLVPLVGADRPLGLLALYHRRDRTWPDEEVALVQAFADQAAVAIQNARLYRSIADQAARMRSIQDLSARLNGLTDVRAIAEAIVAEASTLADYHDIRVYRVDWDRRICEPIAFTREMLEGDPANAEDLLRVAVGEGFTGWVAEHAEPLLANDALSDDRGQTIEGTDDVPESMLVVPMVYEGRAIGVIVLSQLGYDRFTADDLQTMSIFAGYAAQAMANAATYERLVAQSAELSRRAESQRHLLETNERLLSTLDQAGVLETIADGLRDVVAYDNLSIYRADPVLRVMQPVLTRERHADEVSRYQIPFGRGLMGWAVEHSQPILANDALNDPRALQIPGTPAETEAVIVVPLVAEGEVLGALNVSRVGGAEVHFSDSDFELVQLFAAQASIALRNADAHHAMSQRAETDALTGLGNHGAFQRDLNVLLHAAAMAPRQSGRRLALLMMDLDRFKSYNDRHGHPAGDALLHRVATAIYSTARSEDRVYRYGGDELAIILPATGVAAAARVGERVRRAVSRLAASEGDSVTITVGVAAMPDDGIDRPSLIAAADTALYYGKRTGGNRVIRADRLTADMGDLRGTLEELASAALREGDDQHAVEHLVEAATQLAAPHHDDQHSVRDALLTVARSLEAGAIANRGHADRVGRLAAAIADKLELAVDDRRSIELAARLHAVDETSVTELGPISSMREVAAIVMGYRALVRDGRRRRRRTARARGRIGAHVVAVANAYDERVSGVGRERVGRAEALDEVRRDPATFRADVLDALAAVVGRRPDVGRRRRGDDAPDREELGAA